MIRDLASAIPVDPTVAQWLFLVLQGLEQRSGLTATPWSPIEAAAWEPPVQPPHTWTLTGDWLRIYVTPKITYPASTIFVEIQIRRGVGLIGFEGAWEFPSQGSKPLSEFLDEIWARCVRASGT